MRQAAKTLGYTKKLWDKDEEPPTNDKDWEELTTEEQEAALVLGFTEDSWDDD